MISTVEKVLFLKSIDLFSQIPGEDLAQVALIATEDAREQGEEIFAEGEAGDALYLVLEDMIEFDERVRLWRGRHVLMVERMIGMKPGTGGSLGVSYLQHTLQRRFFPELWEVRTVLGGASA